MTSIKKLPKSQYPSGHTENDFSCEGPVATKDGEFANTKLADLACFKQAKVDSNKFYHAAIVKSKVDGSIFVYFQWGRVGGHIDFQFLPCNSESQAQLEYEKQLHKKNDKRGVWEDNEALGKVLRPKPGKDVYLISPKTTRNTGLPDARNIGSVQPTTIKKKKLVFDKESDKLLCDLNAGAISYTRHNIVGGDIPTVDAIEDAKKILDEAVRINNGRSTHKDQDLLDLTSILYSRIPKIKAKNANRSTWILNPNNIQSWSDDIDAFETALKSSSTQDINNDYPFELEFLPFNSKLGKFIKEFFEKGTRNRHSYITNSKVKNMWRFTKRSEQQRISLYQKKLEKIRYSEKPLHQPKSRIDLENDRIDVYNNTNTCMLFHGTRSVNVAGIMDKSLCLPKKLKGVQITGAMFGPGTYWADDWKKSAGYTSYKGSYWSNGSGGINSRGAFIFIADVVLGNPHVPRSSKYFSGPPSGYHSIFGKASVSYLQNNEFITFNENANQLRYLVEFE
jgi:predicted DNA-binding WGR domain protein